MLRHTQLSTATIVLQTICNFVRRPGPVVLTSKMCMLFFASKAWRIWDRSIVVGVVLAIGVLYSFAANLAKATTLAIHVNDSFEDLKAAMSPVQWSAHLGSAITDILCVVLRPPVMLGMRSAPALLQPRLDDADRPASRHF